MTNKRKQLNRLIQKEYRQFETMIISKDDSNRIILQIFNLLYYKIEYLYFMYRISYQEKVFMKQCNIHYMHYYHKMIAHIYE